MQNQTFKINDELQYCDDSGVRGDHFFVFLKYADDEPGAAYVVNKANGWTACLRHKNLCRVFKSGQKLFCTLRDQEVTFISSYGENGAKVMNSSLRMLTTNINALVLRSEKPKTITLTSFNPAVIPRQSTANLRVCA